MPRPRGARRPTHALYLASQPINQQQKFQDMLRPLSTMSHTNHVVDYADLRAQEPIEQHRALTRSESVDSSFQTRRALAECTRRCYGIPWLRPIPIPKPNIGIPIRS